MLTIARGLALWMSDKTPISLIELEILQGFGSGRVLGVPVPALVFVAVAIAGWVLLNRTTFGRRAVAVGGNRSAARIAGIRPGRVIFAVYVLTGLCVGISAILLSGRLASASPVVGNLVELDAIAAVVIGGTALTGGKATVTGTFFGVITFGADLQLAEPAQHARRDPRDRQGRTHPRCRGAAAPRLTTSSLSTALAPRGSRKEEEHMRLPRMLVLGVALAAITLTACTNEVPNSRSEPAASQAPSRSTDRGRLRACRQGRLQRPGADHGWLKAITDNARTAADKLGSTWCCPRAPTTPPPGLSGRDADQPEAGCAGHPPQ